MPVCVITSVTSPVRILWVTNVVPWPPYGGVQLRVFNLLIRILRTHQVTLACHSWNDQDDVSARELTRRGIRTFTTPMRRANWRHALPAFRDALNGTPPEIAQYWSSNLQTFLARETFDVLQIEETLLTPYATRLHRPHTKSIVTFHNVQFAQGRRIAAIERWPWKRSWRRVNAHWMARYEPAVAARFDGVISVSEADRDLLVQASPGLKVEIIPNGVDTREMPWLSEERRKRAIVFVGSLSYRPCIDAAQWLTREILPILRKDLPDIEVWLVGNLPSREVEALAAEKVFVAGPVTDVRPFYQRATVAVAPLRAGGGSRLKILEAMALGRAVVSTTTGAEGLDVHHGDHLLIADAAEAFARSIVRLFADDELRCKLTRQARRLVEDRYDWDAIAESQLRIYENVMATSA